MTSLRATTTTVNNLRAVVEVVPVVAGAHPVVVGGGVVGLVVGVSRGVVELAGLGVLAGGLGVEGGGGLTVKGGEPGQGIQVSSVPRMKSNPSPQSSGTRARMKQEHEFQARTFQDHNH